MTTKAVKTTLAIGLAGALAAAAATPSFAAPVALSTAQLSTEAPSATIDVRYRHHYYRYGPGAAIAGLALGIIGAAAAHAYYDDGPYYYAPSYGYYDYGYAPYGYAYAPAPYWGWHHHHHWHHWNHW